MNYSYQQLGRLTPELQPSLAEREAASVLRWRFGQLTRSGYAAEDAAERLGTAG